MAPPGETQNQDTEKRPEVAAQTPEKPSVPIETGLHREAKDHLKDNAEFLSGVEKADQKEVQKNIEQAAKWQNEGDIDLLRAAGMSLEQVRANPMERHIRLAAMFLERQKAQSGLYFMVNMHDHEEIQWDLDLADIFPANILTLDLYDDKGKLVYAGAIRGIEDGRPGYFDPKTKERIYAQQGMGIRVKETQSSMALKDPVYGQQASLHNEREQSYLTKNAQKTVLKEHAREEAAKQGKELKTDKSFFDVFLEDITNAWNSSGLGDPNNPTKFDFSKLGDSIMKLLESFGFAKAATTATTAATTPGQTTGQTSGGAVSKPSTAPSAKPSVSADKPANYKETKESRNSPKINRQWLMENVGHNEREVQQKMVPINFLGTNLRVCKYIAPYLKEAEERAKEAGIDYRADPKQTSCFNWRPIRNGSILSMHSWGTAIDINSGDNPYQPGLRNNPQNKNRVKTNMPPALIAIMADVGMRNLWWDPMHFELAVNPFKNQGVLRSHSARDLAEKYLA